MIMGPSLGNHLPNELMGWAVVCAEHLLRAWLWGCPRGITYLPPFYVGSISYRPIRLRGGTTDCKLLEHVIQGYIKGMH